MKDLDFKTWNGKITNVSLSMADYGCLMFSITIDGSGVGCNFGGYVLGHGYVGANEFQGSASGMECIMRIMDTLESDTWEGLVGKYVRVRDEGFGSTVKCIGHFTKDKWFDIKKFFEDKEKEEPKKPIPKNVDELRRFVGKALKDKYEKVDMMYSGDDIVVNVEEYNNGRNDVWIQFPYFHSR